MGRLCACLFACPFVRVGDGSDYRFSVPHRWRANLVDGEDAGAKDGALGPDAVAPVTNPAEMRGLKIRAGNATAVTNREKLDRLRERLLAEQRRVIMAAADVDVLPSKPVLARTADLEIAITTVEALIEDDEAVKTAD